MDGGAVLWASNRRVSDLIPSKSPHDRLRRQQLFEDLMSSWSVHGILENDGNFVRPCIPLYSREGVRGGGKERLSLYTSKDASL